MEINNTKLMKTTILITCVVAAVLLCSVKPPKKPVTELKDLQKMMKAGYAYVSSGITLMDGDTVSVQGFFMMNTEVSNFSYLEYLSYIRKHGTPAEYQQALPDTSKWNTDHFKMKAFETHYFSHPAYREFPVVNISYGQAEKFCDWLSMIWQKNTLNPNIKFRLPNKAEFLRAANGSSLERPYAWNGPYLRNEKGNLQCNFLNIGSEAISRDEETGKLIVLNRSSTPAFSSNSNHTDLMCPTKAYLPNEFGLYNLNGNVSEMIAEKGIAVGGDWNSPGYDIRNQSTKKYSEPDPTIGFRPVMTFVESTKK